MGVLSLKAAQRFERSPRHQEIFSRAEAGVL